MKFTPESVGRAIGGFVLGVDHFGKDHGIGRYPRSNQQGQASAISCWPAWRQARSSPAASPIPGRGGPQAPRRPPGPGIPVRAAGGGGPEPDEDGEPITTMVVDWTGPVPETQSGPDDPWAKPKRQDQRTAALRLKRVLMTILAERGVDQPIAPDGPVVRMVDQKLVRKAFYDCTPAEGSPEQKGRLRRQRFLAALDWAEQKQLIGVGEIGDVGYLWLARLEERENEDA